MLVGVFVLFVVGVVVCSGCVIGWAGLGSS